MQKKEKSDQDNQIQLLEERYRTTILLQDKTSQLLIQGKELVDITKTCECPLCHTKHEDYLALISRITADYKGNVEMDIIETNLEASKKINSIIVENLAVESENLKKSLEEVLEVKKGIFNKQNEKIRRLQLQINDWNNLSNNLQNENVSIQNRYNSITIDIQNSEAINLFKSEIDKSIVDLSQIIADEEVKIASDLVLVNNLVGEILLSDSEIKNTQNKVLGTREEIDGKYSSILDKIQEESVVTDGYRLRLKKVFENEDIENADNFEVLEKKKSDIIKKNNRVSENISLLQSLLSNVNGLKEQKIWINRKKESESKKAKLNNIQTKRAALEKSKVVVETYIVNQTNAYFNSNTINQIYNKIDPHPTMNHIKFLTERSDKGLKTNIYTYDESEEDKMSPVLYLSSAQVNILSLCIFLAKVLTEQDTTLNTIFMDDPIQHLDGINLLAFIDLLRTITTTMGRQIVISTHNEHFYNLIKVKMDDRYYLSKFIELNSVGEVRKIINY